MVGERWGMLVLWRTLRCGVLVRFVNRNGEVGVQARCLHHLIELPSLAVSLAP